MQVFQPQSLFHKDNNGGTSNVWFYDMKADGYSLDDKRVEIKENDIPDIIERFKNRKMKSIQDLISVSWFQ